MGEVVERLLSPIAPDQFLAEFYEQKPLLLGGRPDTFYLNVYSTPMLEHTLWRHERSLANFVRLHKSGHNIDPPKSLGRFDFFGWVIAEYQDGATIIVNNLEDYEPALARFIRPLEHYFRGRVSVSAYASPRAASAFSPHFDTHDVMILQVEGSKTFNLYEGVGPELPLISQARRICKEELKAPADAASLAAGDFLYMPRGLVHDAKTSSLPSLHLSLGIHPLSVGRLIGSAVERATEHSLALRRTASADPRSDSYHQVRQLLAALSETTGAEISIENLLEQWHAKLIASQRSLPGKRLSGKDQEHALSIESVVSRAEGATCIVLVDDRCAAIAFPGIGVVRDDRQMPLRIELPIAAASALRFIANHPDRFFIRDIPDCLSNSSKVMLTKRLISEGLLVAS